MERSTKLEVAIGYSFKDKTLLERALVHASSDAQPAEVREAERLSWLGDAILYEILSDILFTTHPKATKEQLHNMRDDLKANTTLGRIGSELGVEEAANIGDSLKMNLAASDRHDMIAGLLEGVLGAVYLDGGIDEARSVVLRILQVEFGRFR